MIIDDRAREPNNAVDELRIARAAVGAQAGGLDGLGEYLAKLQEQYRTRTGPFADVPTARPEEVQRLIDAVEMGEARLDARPGT